MVDFLQLQEIMKERLEHDRSINTVEVVGPTLELAISDAAALLDVPVRRLEYEIIEKGSAGFLGVGKTEWRLHAYEYASSRKKKKLKNLFEDELENTGPVIEDKD